MVADDYSGTGYTKPLRLRSEAVDDIKVIKAAAENMAQNKLREVMPGDQCASYPCARCTRFAQRAALSSIGQPHIGLHPIVYTEGAISVLTNTLRAVLYNTGLPKFLCSGVRLSDGWYINNRMPTKYIQRIDAV